MCYKVSTASERKLRAYLQETGEPVTVQPYEQYYHANAFNYGIQLPVQLNTEPGVIQPAYWKLIPWYIKDTNKAQALHGTQNARSEEIFETRSYKPYITKYRALLWVDGFVEPHTHEEVSYGPKGEKRKATSYPYYVYRKDHQPFTLGCVWAPWVDTATGELRNTFSIITTPANKLLATIHNNKERMPLVIPPAERRHWLADIDEGEIKTLMRTLPDGELTAHPITKDINKGSINTPDMIAVCDNGLNLVLE